MLRDAIRQAEIKHTLTHRYKEFTTREIIEMIGELEKTDFEKPPETTAHKINFLESEFKSYNDMMNSDSLNLDDYDTFKIMAREKSDEIFKNKLWLLRAGK